MAYRDSDVEIPSVSVTYGRERLQRVDLTSFLQFGHTLTEAEGAAPLEFQNYFIKYRSLKKILKHRRHSGGNQQEKDQAVQAEKAFLKMLYVQLKEVDRYGLRSTTHAQRRPVSCQRSDVSCLSTQALPERSSEDRIPLRSPHWQTRMAELLLRCPAYD